MLGQHLRDAATFKQRNLRVLREFHLRKVQHHRREERQPEIGLDREMPVFHATQLAALAFELEAKAAALDKNVIDPRPLLADKALFGRGVAGR